MAADAALTLPGGGPDRSRAASARTAVARRRLGPRWQIGGMDFRRAFRAAAVSFADVVARVPDGRWDEPAEGDRTLRELAARAADSGLRQVPSVLATPADEVARASSEDYWLVARPSDDSAEGLAGVPVGDLVGLATQALGRVEDDALVTTRAGGMRVRDWIPTRTLLLVMRGLDVAAAAGVELFLAPEVYADVAAQAARTAAMAGDGPAVLRALTGRVAGAVQQRDGDGSAVEPGGGDGGAVQPGGGGDTIQSGTFRGDD